MNYRVLLFGGLFFSSITLAVTDQKNTSQLIDAYVKIHLDFDNIKKVCGAYDYQVLETKTEKLNNGVRIIDWMVIDKIGTKMDQRFFTFQTTNLEVTSMFTVLSKSKDWQKNIDGCKST
jgi:hypothetical protein